ncbi:uncharacterized protein RCC_09886 [Ramularia collo-cygni]|uniref:Uncharacterized protein n=1 Tax=Ramularia collo-cygni TaxID=112498 RepID=A0A2D3VKY3_9PEZI|nr:uncharacterized protein RCC_09886 [Ramularia collo-cygni]CZT24169.1 uncharacterized protein RCC_09886 [Ramularia collo-cygni]
MAPAVDRHIVHYGPQCDDMELDIPAFITVSNPNALDQRIEALPQELKDMIVEHLVAATMLPQYTIVPARSANNNSDSHLNLARTSSLGNKGTVIRVHYSSSRPPNTYKPPAGLQINRKTRAEFAKSYYRNNIFSAKTWEMDGTIYTAFCCPSQGNIAH